MPFKVNTRAMAAAYQAAPETPCSIIEQAIFAYLRMAAVTREPGSAAHKIAALAVGESVVIEKGPSKRTRASKRPPYLQPATKKNARILLGDPGADWKSTPVGFGYKVTRKR